MRLTAFQIAAIKESFCKSFASEDHLWLFGSRVDPTKRGGDIDLYIETKYSDTALVLQKKIRFLVDLQLKIGEQKIDVVINILSLGKALSIYEEARKTGIKIV